jgi:hypothetical protein
MNIHISHLALHSMINMTLKWHHKNIFNKIAVFIKFWWLPNVFFGSFDCDCTWLTSEHSSPPPSIIALTYRQQRGNG